MNFCGTNPGSSLSANANTSSRFGWATMPAAQLAPCINLSAGVDGYDLQRPLTSLWPIFWGFGKFFF